jgi:hypothetical protein
MTVNMLIQIDKLVQLLESPVFTYLRLQLLEPEKYPFLFKCLYGVLMLLPQSSAFAALKNRLNSVNNIGFLHGGPRSTTQTAPSFDRSTGTRLKSRDENSIRWVELLDKFKAVQERARRSQGSTRQSFDQSGPPMNPTLTAALSVAAADRPKDRSNLPDAPRGAPGPSNAAAGNTGLGGPGPSASGTAAGRALDSSAAKSAPTHKHKSSLPNLGRLGIGGRKSKK